MKESVPVRVYADTYQKIRSMGTCADTIPAVLERIVNEHIQRQQQRFDLWDER